MTESGSGRMLERLLYAAIAVALVYFLVVIVALVYFGGFQATCAERSETEELRTLANHREFILDTMKCECPEE